MSRHYKLGQHAQLRVQTTDADGAPVVPDACPTIDVYDTSGTKIVSAFSIPIHDRYGTTGQFAYQLFLDGAFTANYYYTVRYKWTAGAFNGVRLGGFAVLAGGNASGQYISAIHILKPFASFLVGQTDGGVIERVRNPKF